MSLRLGPRVAAAMIGGTCLGTGLAAQGPAVPKFPIADSPVQLTGDVRSHQYVGVIGRAAAWLGRETGEAELWIHPLKLAAEFQLDFRIPDYVEPVRGRDIARTIVVRPELTTIVYTHATFTVRQHILAPLHEPGLLVLLDVDTFRDLEIVASFKSVFQYAWPGSMGGQYAFWDASARVFVLSESQRRRNAVIGSPWTTEASDHPAHALPDAPSTFAITVAAERAAREFIPIAITGGTAPRDTVLDRYRRLLRDAERLYRERVDHATQLLSQTTAIESPDDSLDLAFAWAKINLDEQLTCNPDLGCGLVAGWGPSGTGTRPGFGWFFGGDAAINSFAMDATGLWNQVAQGLRFLARYQDDRPRATRGKIPHEISQSAATIPWFTEFPYAYYHADTTPYWMVAVWRYWRASGDDATLAELWPAMRRAYAWALTRDTDGDGLIENGPGNLGAIEVGALGEGIHQDIYLAAVWTHALDALADMADYRGDGELATEARARFDRARATLNAAYWRETEQHHAFGILESGATNDNLTVWPATAAAFRLLDPDRAVHTLTKIASDRVTADWGARMLSTASPLFDPMHYNNGAVWPFVTGFVSWGHYNYQRPWSAYPALQAVSRLTFDWARGRHPELLSGRYYRPLDTAVPQQFFATSMLISPLTYGLVGWDPDAPRARARLAPQLPPDWPRLTVRRLRAGDDRIDAVFRQAPGEFTTVITRTRGVSPFAVDLAVPVPPGATGVEWTTDPEISGGEVQTRPLGRRLEIALPLTGSPQTVRVRWQGGLQVVPPIPELRPGQSSRGLRIVQFENDAGEWVLTGEGTPGQRYEVTLIGSAVRVASGIGVTSLRRSGDRTTFIWTFRGGRDRETQTIRVQPER